MAADSDGDWSAKGPDPNRLHRIRYLSEAAGAAIDQGKEDVAETNLNEALSEIRSYRHDIEVLIMDDDIDASQKQLFKNTVEKLNSLEENIQKQLKIL